MAARRRAYRDAVISIDGRPIGQGRVEVTVKEPHERTLEEIRARQVIAHVKKDRTCAYCGRAIAKAHVGAYSIHRDGMSEGPEVPLCERCAISESPSLADIWARIGQADHCRVCSKDILPGDERAGSYHAWCYNPT